MNSFNPNSSSSRLSKVEIFVFVFFFNGSYSKFYSTTISIHFLSNVMQYLGFNLHSVWLLSKEKKSILNSFNPNGSSRLGEV